MRIVWAVLAAGVAVALVVGLFGVTYEGTAEDVPAPPQAIAVGIHEEPLPASPAGAFVPLEITLEWDNDGVWFGLIDANEEARCSPNAAGVSLTCRGSGMDFVAGGPGTASAQKLTAELPNEATYLVVGHDSGAGLDGSTDLTYDVHVSLGGLASGGLVVLELVALGLAFRPQDEAA